VQTYLNDMKRWPASDLKLGRALASPCGRQPTRRVDAV
jgi:hypothetical protein